MQNRGRKAGSHRTQGRCDSQGHVQGKLRLQAAGADKCAEDPHGCFPGCTEGEEMKGEGMEDTAS